MKPTRRECLAKAATTLAGVTAASQIKTVLAETTGSRYKVGMCDWSMDCRADIKAFARAKKIGLDGVEVSIGYPADNLKLRFPREQKAYLAEARKHGVAIASVAMGVLNDVPLMSEPRAALWVADTIEAARNLGAPIILLAFFGKGELKEENETDMRRVTEVLQELAPRAEKARVILGLENYLTAEANLKIIEQVKSRAVQVYYDVFNSAHKNHNVVKEIKLLGKKHICRVHFKEGKQLLGSGKIDWPAVAAAMKEIKYDDWLILETKSPQDVITDTKKNMQYLLNLFKA